MPSDKNQSAPVRSNSFVDDSEDDLGLDELLSADATAEIKDVDISAVKETAEKGGFTSRQATSAAKKPPKKKPAVDKVSRRQKSTTGEGTTMLGIRCKIDTNNVFQNMCIDNAWTSEETLKYALDALQLKVADKSDRFWHGKKIPK